MATSPIKRGDWVAQESDVYQPHFGVVKDTWSDNGEVLLNIVMYSPSGQRVGRHSAPEGGPTSYEPACPAKYYQKIAEPCFPLDLDLRGNHAGSLKYL